MTVHLGLCLLVVVNLLFVHITGVVGMTWVVAFTALTLFAPLLRRYADSLGYRVAWNAVVLVLFASLVQRTLQQGVGRMLESGLVLAAFCQVHLVNNVSARQRPDLLLFNSFLIALITAFFCQQVAYCAVFVAYVFALITIWRLLAHRDSRGTASVALVMRDGVRQAACALAGTIAVFLFWPRDFERAGLVGDHLLQAAQSQVGIADEIRLSHALAPVQSDRLVMRITGAGEIPTHWRGSTFRLLHQGAWHATTTAQDAERAGQVGRERSLDPEWREQERGRWARPSLAPGATLRVELLDADSARLFLPLAASSLHLSEGAAHVPHLPLVDGTFALFSAGDEPAGALAYVVECGAPADPVPSVRRLEGWLGIDPAATPGEALVLAQEVRASLPRAARVQQVAEAMCSRLRAEFTYGLPGHAGSASDLHEFFVLRRGHCEFFASALALMLRSQRIACRLVGGFLATERDAQGAVVVRAKHAHAWVEVWDPEVGWCTADPTPAADEDAHASWWSGLRARAEEVWTAVTGFDARRRAELVAWCAGVPGRVGSWVVANPLWAMSVLGLAVVWMLCRQPRGDVAVRGYVRAVRRAGLLPRGGETPRQLLSRARSAGLPARMLADLVAATQAHERARYRTPAAKMWPASARSSG